MDGIRSYNELDEICVKILEKSTEIKRASQIHDILIANYTFNSLRISPKKIGKRISKLPQVTVLHTKRGTNFYRYNKAK